MARKTRGLPPGARETSPGRYAITFATEENGRAVRRSHSKVKPDEPKTYGEAELWAGYERVREFLTHQTERGVTLGEFWEQWTDPEHWRWAVLKKRSPQSITKYRSATRSFVQHYTNGVRNYDRPIEAITAEHIEAFMASGGKLSNLTTLGTFFNDAIEARVRTTHPCAELSKQAASTAVELREAKRRWPPGEDQIATMLDRASQPSYPRSVWGWLSVGTETGMRGGEIDAMSWEYLDGNRYYIAEQWNVSARSFTDPKHDSKRWLVFDDDLMEIIESFRGEHSRFVFTNPRAGHWSQDTRDYWWTWTRDGGPSLMALAEGRTMKEATRHFWAWRAVNVWGVSPYQASLLYGHSDGGKVLTEHYVMPDHERALVDVLARKRAQVVDLSAQRRRRSA